MPYKMKILLFWDILMETILYVICCFRRKLSDVEDDVIKTKDKQDQDYFRWDIKNIVSTNRPTLQSVYFSTAI